MFRSLFLVPVLYIVLAAPKPLAKPTGDVAISENKDIPDSKALPTVEGQDAATPWDLKDEAFAGATPWGALRLSDETLNQATPWGLLKKLNQEEIEEKTTWEPLEEEKTTWQPLEEATPWGVQDIATPWDRYLLPNFKKVTWLTTCFC